MLGEDAGTGGPFALLGIGHGTTDPASVRAALRRRLDRLDRHPGRRTPEAEELRLALHAAAAQVLDPGLHAELVRLWPEGSGAHTPAPWRTHLSEVSDTLVRRARLIVGASGGWGPRARTRLAHLARVQRVSAIDLIGAIRPRGPTRTARAEPAGTPRIEINAPGSTGRVWVLIHGALAAMLLVCGALLVSEAVSDHPAKTIAIVEGAKQDPETIGTRATEPAIPGPRSDLDHHTAMIQELRNATRIAGTEPAEAGRRAARVIGAFATRWPAMPGEARERIANATAEIMASLGDTQDAAPLLSAARAGDPGEGPVAWSGRAALGVWWRSWPGMPRPLRDRLEDGLPAQAGGGFDGALAAALAGWADQARAIEGADWSAWSDALASCRGAPGATRAQTRLALLESALTEDGVALASLRGMLGPVAGGLSWRSGEPARAWLIERFGDPRVPSARLSALTELLATRLAAPGVDPSMVLPPDAGPEARDALAAAYRAAWVSLSGMNDPMRAEVLDALSVALLGTQGTELDRLLMLARANAAAATLFAGDASLAAELLASPIPEPPRDAPRADTGVGLDDAWAAEAFATDEPEAVVDRLRQAGGARAPFGPLAAEWVLTQATQGASREARELAREIVVTRSRDVQILLGLERAAVRRPSAAVGDLVTDVTGRPMPGAADPSWPDAVRDALLPLAVDRLVPESPDALVYAELHLSDMAARRAGGASGEAILLAVAGETDDWLRRNTLPPGDRLSASAVASRLGAGLARARSSSQRVAVRHRALVEAIAGSLVSQGVRPRPSVERVLERFSQEWADAQSLLGQLVASHRAEASLWRALLEGSL